MFRGWRIAAIIVLAITGVSWLFFREYAGFVGGGAWFEGCEDGGAQVIVRIPVRSTD